MKTNVTSDSMIRTRKNTAMLLTGFLTPVVLLGGLAVSLFNSGSSEAKDKTEKKYAVKNVYLTEEMSVSPNVCIYDNNGNEEELPIVLDKDDIRFGDTLLPSLGRRF